MYVIYSDISRKGKETKKKKKKNKECVTVYYLTYLGAKAAAWSVWPYPIWEGDARDDAARCEPERDK